MELSTIQKLSATPPPAPKGLMAVRNEIAILESELGLPPSPPVRSSLAGLAVLEILRNTISACGQAVPATATAPGALPAAAVPVLIPPPAIQTPLPTTAAGNSASAISAYAAIADPAEKIRWYRKNADRYDAAVRSPRPAEKPRAKPKLTGVAIIDQRNAIEDPAERAAFYEKNSELIDAAYRALNRAAAKKAERKN